MPQTSLPEIGVFGPDAGEAIDAFIAAHGFAIIRGLYSPALVADMLAECVDLQAKVVSGDLAPRHGNVVLTDAYDDAPRFANYVQYVTEIAPITRAAVTNPVITAIMARRVPGGHLREHSRFGVVYQDARPSRDSGYKRIGWHSDWQSGPQLDVWPSLAFTIHLDATSPENGFLRVVPGSHLWATPAPYQNANNMAVPAGARATGGYTDAAPPLPMPLGFEKIPGEFAIYCEVGDVLLHDAYLWHSAASATDGEGIRRHVRGAWFTGPPDAEHRDFEEEFVKNAAR